MKKAFTLIELLIVITIITVLTGFLLPALGEARKEGYKSVCASNLRGMAQAMEMYRADYNDIYPCKDDTVSPWLWMGRGFRPVLEPYIAPGLSAKNPNILWCPVEKAAGYENTSYAYSMSFYHSPAQINQMTDKSYTLTIHTNPVPINSGQVAIPANKILIGEWYSNHKPVTGDYSTEPGWWSWKGSRNYLFADGHVQFIAATKIRPANDGFADPNLTQDGVEGSDI
jgi:prepilin-type N-terminal cleavage/methylation domain-containing protein/prepilin-type processing-associated H-X9-DG protein